MNDITTLADRIIARREAIADEATPWPDMNDMLLAEGRDLECLAVAAAAHFSDKLRALMATGFIADGAEPVDEERALLLSVLRDAEALAPARPR